MFYDLPIKNAAYILRLNTKLILNSLETTYLTSPA